MKKAVLIALVCAVAGFAFGTSTGQALQSYNSAFTLGAKSSAWLQVGFTLPEYTISDELKGSVNYKKISIADAGTLLQSGMPEFPTISTSIAVPNHGSVSIEVISAQQHTVAGFMPYPVQQGAENVSPKSFQYNSDYYSNGGNYPEAAIQYSDPMIVRDFRIVTIQI
ncbi:MAG: C25 family peptidase propeptide domain-containing protein, partial [Candidatus Cloacimonetes bacterium]|nr:C25 family peptidase propeptide domain-containing protein [Candidatus Cloacimonadota bacterium]